MAHILFAVGSLPCACHMHFAHWLAAACTEPVIEVPKTTFQLAQQTNLTLHMMMNTERVFKPRSVEFA
eukprot:640000-Amphidinium_carterae.2